MPRGMNPITRKPRAYDPLRLAVSILRTDVAAESVSAFLFFSRAFRYVRATRFGAWIPGIVPLFPDTAGRARSMHTLLVPSSLSLFFFRSFLSRFRCSLSQPPLPPTTTTTTTTPRSNSLIRQRICGSARFIRVRSVPRFLIASATCLTLTPFFCRFPSPIRLFPPLFLTLFLSLPLPLFSAAYTHRCAHTNMQALFPSLSRCFPTCLPARVLPALVF